MLIWLATLLCWLTFSNVAINAGTSGIARCFFLGATLAVALDELLLFSALSCSDGGAKYPVGCSIVGA